MPSGPAKTDNLKSMLESRPVKFKIQTGGTKYECSVHVDRASYERVKTVRTDSTASISSASTSSTTSSK